MNNVMTNGFCELNENEMMAVDGGWDGLQWAWGTAAVIVGGFGATASLITGNADGVITGIGIASAGSSEIYNSYFN